MTRSKDQIRADKLTVMSAALDLFRTRKANLARRDRWMARDMRWAGEEARFCIAQVKAEMAWNAQIRKTEADIAASYADMTSRMTPEQKEARVRSLLGELDRLVYAPWGINASVRRKDIRAQLELLQAPAPVPEGPVTTTPAKAIGLVAALLAVS